MQIIILVTANAHLQKAAIEFHNLVDDTCADGCYNADLCFLEKRNNILKFRSSTGEKHTVLPTYMVSKNLTNSMHVDINDGCKSYALFYTTTNQHCSAVT